MSGPMLSRSQRRMEKRQALTLLGLVLAVALASFVLGVMVGRSAAPETARQPVPSRLPVTATPVIQPADPPEDSAPAPEKLTFYETLSQGEAPPMGSGINLPPQPKAPAEEDVTESPSAPTAVDPPVSTAVSTRAPLPGTTAEGSFLVQAASFRDAPAARSLQQKLDARGYPASIQEVDLGPKGVWYRVMAGTYASADQAERVVAELGREFRLSAMVRRP